MGQGEFSSANAAPYGLNLVLAHPIHPLGLSGPFGPLSSLVTLLPARRRSGHTASIPARMHPFWSIREAWQDD
jgi:hypothetical protein